MKKLRTFVFYIAIIGLVTGVSAMLFASNYIEHGDPKRNSPFQILQMVSSIALLIFLVGTVVLWFYAFIGSFSQKKADISRLVKVILGNVFSGYIYYVIDKKYSQLPE